MIWKGTYTNTSGALKARDLGKLVMQWDDDLYSVEDRGDDSGYFINHSCNANLWMKDAYTLCARRNIEPGEEITADYALWEFDPKFQANWICNCLAQDCRKQITGNDWKLSSVQTKYAGHFSPLINKLISQHN